MRSLWKMFVAAIVVAATSSVGSAQIVGYSGAFGALTPVTANATHSFAAGGAASIISSNPPGLTGSSEGVTFTLTGVSMATVLGTDVYAGTATLQHNPAGPNFVTLPTAGGAATFLISNLPPFTLAASAPTMTNPTSMGLTGLGALTLVSNTSGTNFGPIGGIWDLSISITNSSGVVFTTGGAGTVAFPGNSTPAGTYSLTFTGRIKPPDDVPEPTSMALFGLMGVAGGMIVRRKQKKAQVA